MSLLYLILVLFDILSQAYIRLSFKSLGISPSFLMALITQSKDTIFAFDLG